MPQLTPAIREFLSQRHLATLTTQRADGSPHVTAVGFTYDEAQGVVRIISWEAAAKARNAARGGRPRCARWTAVGG